MFFPKFLLSRRKKGETLFQHTDLCALFCVIVVVVSSAIWPHRKTNPKIQNKKDSTLSASGDGFFFRNYFDIHPLFCVLLKIPQRCCYNLVDHFCSSLKRQKKEAQKFDLRPVTDVPPAMTANQIGSAWPATNSRVGHNPRTSTATTQLGIRRLHHPRVERNGSGENSGTRDNSKLRLTKFTLIPKKLAKLKLLLPNSSFFFKSF